MGFGFMQFPKSWDSKHRFIRGNHDDPAECRKHPNYLGDYGVTKDGIFFVGGAFSIDRKYRIPGVSWWEDEELPISKYEVIVKAYEEARPDIVVAHDCPSFLKNHGLLGGRDLIHNRTGDILLPALIDVHIPSLWVFGHYHQHIEIRAMGTRYVGLNELEVLTT